MEEKILCAAIWYDDGKKRDHQPINIETGIVVCGLRHCNCFIILYELAKPDYNKQKVEQGFLTNTGRFVERKEAFLIAHRNKQILITERISKAKSISDLILYSEDLY